MTDGALKKEFLQLRDRILERQFGHLNERQREAVFSVDGPLLILAGAGSGKTSVLANRIAYMAGFGDVYNSGYVPDDLEKDDLQLMMNCLQGTTPTGSTGLTGRIEQLLTYKRVNPFNILAITFTNKAAREMKERVQRLVGNISDSIWISTFHSACVRILRKDIDKLGFDRNFVIYDAADQQTLIKDCIKELNLNEKNYAPRSVLETIGKAKDELTDPKKYSIMYAGDFRLSKIAMIYELYQKKLMQNNALDFDDIIYFTVRLFEENPPVLQYYRRRFEYILVDEYQDTNTSQYSLISHLSGPGGNLCVVGDDDQSIYGWRGANIRNILDFEKEFKDCKVVKLEQNYRSTQNILDAANSVIRNNTARKVKKLWTQNSKGHKIQYYESDNEHDEALFAAREIKKLKACENKKFMDFAVLYRINAQSRVIEDIFMREGIPYEIVGGIRFYGRKEIKDVVAYLRVIQNPNDNISLKRIINVPRRGIGDATVEIAEAVANRNGCSIFTVISSASEIPELQRSSSKLEKFTGLISGLRALKENVKVSVLIEEAIEQSGIVKELTEEKTSEAETRLENIRELISVAIELEEQLEEQVEVQEEGQELEAFLAHVSLVSDIDSLDAGKDSVVLMTLHSAKGLEFPVVFMVGVEEGLFPGYRSMIEEKEIEEERRLCYVGITRAMERVYITNAFCRTLFGNTVHNGKSRFVKEISWKLLDDLSKNDDTDDLDDTDDIEEMEEMEEMEEVHDIYDTGYGNKKYAGYDRYTGYDKPGGHADDTGNVKGSGFSVLSGTGNVSGNRHKPGIYNIGDRVRHKKFGDGVITSVEKENGDFKLEIDFDASGMKRLMAAYANLTRII